MIAAYMKWRTDISNPVSNSVIQILKFKKTTALSGKKKRTEVHENNVIFVRRWHL